MNPPDPAALMYDIVSLIEEINLVASGFEEIDGTDGAVFCKLSLRMPNLSPPELGFVRSVSWLWALYGEAGAPNVQFLGDRLTAYGLDPDCSLSAHPETVQHLRAFGQHHLDPATPRNRRIQQHCEHWFQQNCGTAHPGSDDEWGACLLGLLGEAIAFFQALLMCTRHIEKDESRDRIIQDWDLRRKRYHPAHEFDALILEVAADMGRDAVDAVRLRKRFYDRWTGELRLLQGNYDFKTEARKLIEHVLLQESTPVLPITGHDIIDRFGLAPGPQVGDLLDRARALYSATPCPRDELLERLRTEVDASTHSAP